MARVNFREVQARFTHIDARFVGCSCSFPSGSARYDVAIYPSWEHPLYIEARREGKPWGFADDMPDDAYKLVTVHPINVRDAKLSTRFDVIDWSFTQTDPLLWPFEDQCNIICNQPVAVESWLEILEGVRQILGLHDTRPILDCAPIEQVWKYGGSPSSAWAHFREPCFWRSDRSLRRGASNSLSRENRRKRGAGSLYG